MDRGLRPGGGLRSSFVLVACLACGQIENQKSKIKNGPDDPVFAGARPLAVQGDEASLMVDGIDRFLSRELERSTAARGRFWKHNPSSPAADRGQLEANRRRLAHILGVRDPLTPLDRMRAVDDSQGIPGGPRGRPGGRHERVFPFALTVFGDVWCEGLRSTRRLARPSVIVIPDADTTPEQAMGLLPGVAVESQVAHLLADNGLSVFVPSLLDRRLEPRRGRAQLSDREFIHRSAFELGRTTLGYEIQKVLALVERLADTDRLNPLAPKPGPIGVYGHGEGGLIALYAAALDPRIAAVCVSGTFGDRNQMWQEPLERNIFGLLERFGDAETSLLIAPRPLIIEAAGGPEVVIPKGKGAAPGRLTTPSLATVRAEVEKARALAAELGLKSAITMVASGPEGKGPSGTSMAVVKFVEALGATGKLDAIEDREPYTGDDALRLTKTLVEPRRQRQLHELDRHNQALLAESASVRKQHFAQLDKSSPAAYARTIEPYRQEFATEVVGRFEIPLSPPNPRIRKLYDEPRFTGWEVMLDVFPDVFAYGILLVPKGLKPGEKRPVVVCQHGLEGRPRDVADPRVDNPAYHAFAVKLAEQGYLTFAPQNPYIFEDRFRTLQRKANPIGKTLFSIIVPQHRQITDYLASLPFVDPARIAFYGLSYGGKTAMRVPPLVSNYCLSICSADFNEWVWKNASTASDYSYVWNKEYEIFEWDLGSTFNYAEMAALIAPRPFMVERGHHDGVAPDEMVAYEFAKVFRLYDADLKIGDRCRIEFFDGPHTINGKGTFEFLRRFLAPIHGD